MFRNTAGPIAGRVLVALCRLVIAGMIVRFSGIATFAQYSLLFGILLIAEWILDFGTTEIFVREICREPAQAPRLLRVLISAKLVQLPAAIVVLAAILVGFRYPAEIVKAGLVGGAGLVFFVGVLVYRVMFKAALNMEREVAAELLSVVAMIPMVAVVTQRGWGLSALFVCHVASRLIFLTFCALFGRGRLPAVAGGSSWSEVRWGLQTSSAIGLVGFLVVVYEAVDIILLSRLSTIQDVAYYSAAQRFVGPLLMALYAVGATLYPVASSYWPHARDRFVTACQRGFDAVSILAGLAICSMIAGAELILALMGPQLVPAAGALMVLSVLCLAKGISATVGPVLYVAQAQKSALQLIVAALIIKTAAVAIIAPRFGFMGVAFGVLAVEVLFSVLPTLYLLQRYTGFRVQWSTTARVVVFAAMASIVPRLMLEVSLWRIALAICIYVPLLFASGLVRVSDVESLVRWKTAPRPA